MHFVFGQFGSEPTASNVRLESRAPLQVPLYRLIVESRRRATEFLAKKLTATPRMQVFCRRDFVESRSQVLVGSDQNFVAFCLCPVKKFAVLQLRPTEFECSAN